MVPIIMEELETITRMARRVGNWRTNRYHPKYSIVEARQYTEKSPGNLRLAVTQPPMKDHQRTLVGKKTRKE